MDQVSGLCFVVFDVVIGSFSILFGALDWNECFFYCHVLRSLNHGHVHGWRARALIHLFFLLIKILLCFHFTFHLHSSRSHLCCAPSSSLFSSSSTSSWLFLHPNIPFFYQSFCINYCIKIDFELLVAPLDTILLHLQHFYYISSLVHQLLVFDQGMNQQYLFKRIQLSKFI